jgi:hypothetical protein
MEATQQNPARSSLMVWPLPVQPLSSSNVLITAFTHTHARARARTQTLLCSTSDAPRSDDAKCARNYGKDWEEYTKLVPYVFIPGVI